MKKALDANYLINEGMMDHAEITEGRTAIAESKAEFESRREWDSKAIHPHKRAAMKRKAASIGLAYWPALFCKAVDPAAFVAAETVMAKRVGSRYGDLLPGRTGRSRGGWDSEGYHGYSAYGISRMWLIAGCRDSQKFRTMVWIGFDGCYKGFSPKKGDTANQTANFLRGAKWLGKYASHLTPYYYDDGRGMSRKAAMAIGRLSFELRFSAIQGLECGPHRIRVRDLNWSAVAADQKAIARGGDKVSAALTMAAGLEKHAQLMFPDGLISPLYPAITGKMAGRLILGESPRRLSGGLLSKKEAHEWCLDGAPELLPWLADKLGVPAHRSATVIRWLAHCRQTGRWSAVERERMARVPGEPLPRAYSLLSVLDEIQEDDIQSGRDSVDAILQRTAQRLGEAWMSKQMTDHRLLCSLPSWGHRLPHGIRLLRTASDLAKEGKEMSHCVGGYLSAVEKGQCYILAVRTRHGRSTVELSPALDVVQHNGERNGYPPRRNETLIQAFLNRINNIGEFRNAA